MPEGAPVARGPDAQALLPGPGGLHCTGKPVDHQIRGSYSGASLLKPSETDYNVTNGVIRELDGVGPVDNRPSKN